MDQQSLYQIYKACRLCGAAAGYKMPIIHNFIHSDDDTEMNLRKKIADSLQIQVNEGDKMPPLICGICADKVDEFFAFKVLCKQTNELTRKKLGLPEEKVATPETPIPKKKEREESPKRDIKKEKAQAKREADLKNKEAKLKERDIELKTRDKALRVKEIDLKQRDAELKQKDTAIKVKDTNIKNKDSQLKTFDAILRNKDVELTLKQNQIKTKEQELQLIEETKTQKFKEKELALKKKEAELKKKESSLKKMETEHRKKMESERAELRKSELMKRPREPEVDETTVNTRPASASRSSSVSGKPSKKKRKTELTILKLEAEGVTGTSQILDSPRSTQEQEELKARLAKSKEHSVAETPPDKKPKSSPKPSKPTSTPKTPPDQDLLCVVCSAMHKTPKAYKLHVRSHNVTTNPKYVCNACHLWFTNSEELSSHQREHRVNGLPYKCSNCEFIFETEKEYQEHFTKFDCYIFTVPDVQCPSCLRYFATETLKSQHLCLGEEPRESETCAKCNQTFELLKDLKEHELTCTTTVTEPVTELVKEPTEIVAEVPEPCPESEEIPSALEEVKEPEDLCSSKIRGPENVLAEPEVLTSLKPVEVRTEKCDALLESSEDDLVDVSKVDYNYGLDKTRVYPYFTLYPRIKQEPAFNYFKGMVRINPDVKDFLLKDYIHWDSEESENEFSDTKNSDVKVKTLAQLALKVIFSKKLIGKVPRKRRKVKNEFGSVINVSLFDLGSNCFDFSENMDESNEAVNNIIDNLAEDDNSANSNDNIEMKDLDKSKGTKNKETIDTNETEKTEGDKQESADETNSRESNKNMNIPEHSNDVSLYEEYIKSKNNEEQQSLKNGEGDGETTEVEGHRSDSNENNDDENSCNSRTKSPDTVNADENTSDVSNNSKKDVIGDTPSESSIKTSTEIVDNMESRNNKEEKSSLNSESGNVDVDDNKNDSNEKNTSEESKTVDESNINVEQNNLDASIVDNLVQDITDLSAETPKPTTDDSLAVKVNEIPLDSIETNSTNQNIVTSNISENRDQNPTDSDTVNAKNNTENADLNKYDFITRSDQNIPFFDSQDENPIKIHSKDEKSGSKSVDTASIETDTPKDDKFDSKVTETDKAEDGAEMDKLLKDLNELSQDSNTSLSADKQSKADDLKTNDSKVDDGNLMAELNNQIGESDKSQRKDDVNSVDRKSPYLDNISDAESDFD